MWLESTSVHKWNVSLHCFQAREHCSPYIDGPRAKMEKPAREMLVGENVGTYIWQRKWVVLNWIMHGGSTITLTWFCCEICKVSLSTCRLSSAECICSSSRMDWRSLTPSLILLSDPPPPSSPWSLSKWTCRSSGLVNPDMHMGQMKPSVGSPPWAAPPPVPDIGPYLNLAPLKKSTQLLQHWSI